MRNTLLFLFVSLFVAAARAEEPAKATAPAEPDGMKKLFNGKDLAGWDGDGRLWSVVDGAIRGQTTEQNPAKGNTFLIFKGDGDKPAVFKDFDLRMSFRCNAANNSGVQYRSRHIADGKVPNNWVVRGYQHEIRNEIKLPNVAGFIYEEGGKRGRLTLVGEKGIWEDGKKKVTGALCTAEDFEKAFKLDGWNDIVIIARGNHFAHYMNGLQVIDFTDNEKDLAATEGILALQLHAGKPMWVEFKNIRIKELTANQ